MCYDNSTLSNVTLVLIDIFAEGNRSPYAFPAIVNAQNLTVIRSYFFFFNLQLNFNESRVEQIDRVRYAIRFGQVQFLDLSCVTLSSIVINLERDASNYLAGIGLVDATFRGKSSLVMSTINATIINRNFGSMLLYLIGDDLKRTDDWSVSLTDVSAYLLSELYGTSFVCMLGYKTSGLHLAINNCRVTTNSHGYAEGVGLESSVFLGGSLTILNSDLFFKQHRPFEKDHCCWYSQL